MTEEEYRKNAEYLLSRKSDEIFSNGQTAHGAILMETFFRFMKKRVVIFCHNLCSEAYGRPEVIRAAEAALRRGGKIEILTQVAPVESKFKEELANWKAAGLDIDLKTLPAGMDYQFNLAVMDATAFRFEPNPEEHKAIACMHSPKRAESLRDLFYSIEARAF